MALIEIDRRAFITSLGGMAAIGLMSHEARADALEDYTIDRLDEALAQQQQGKYPTVAQLEAQIETRPSRRGVGNLFVNGRGDATLEHVTNVKRLEPMSNKPTLKEFFEKRFAPANHVLQSANRALKTGMSEEVVLACLLHDTVHALIKVDHGWWGAQLYEPYVSPKVTFAIRYHQALRFYPDTEAGYEYPEMYYNMFGVDYQPPPHVAAAYKFARQHKWYMHSRLVTVNDLYAFDRNAVVTIDPFIDIIGRHFKEPKEGLGNDNSPVAHMWRTLANPDSPL
jgi:hypothetical protein